MTRKRILIIGAGPAGLTAGLELVKNGQDVTIVESDPQYVGGISRTQLYKGYKFDIGGHRFFTKNPEIEKFWKDILHEKLLVRDRKSRILYDGKYFNYPITFFNALFNIGLIKAVSSIISYGRFQLFPIKPETSYADWMTNRFGKVLFTMFFKTYTEKIWGMPVESISKDWAVQRVRTFSLYSAVISSIFPWKRKSFRTLTESFLYPENGPGMMWEAVAKNFIQLGGKISMNTTISGVVKSENKWVITDNQSGKAHYDEVISTMPLQSLIRGLKDVPKPVQVASDSLKYRDFITVLLVINKKNIFDDNWIYIHDPNVKVGRIQNFKNWSEHMVPDQTTTSLGFEYFIFENDTLWEKDDEYFLHLAKLEAVQLGFCNLEDITDGTVLKVKKAYPVYDNDYKKHVDTITAYVKGLEGLHTIGRNGMHRWNNQDHSMMTGLVVARNILHHTQQDAWLVNTEGEYQESATRLVPEKM